MDTSPNQRQECFRRISLFAWLDSSHVDSMAEQAEAHFYDEGETIFQAGSIGDGLHVIATGEVTFSSGPPDDYDKQQASTLEAGSFFGELSLLVRRARNSNARAALPTTVYHVPLSLLENLSRTQPDQYAIIMTNLAREMARKIRYLNRTKSATPEPNIQA